MEVATVVYFINDNYRDVYDSETRKALGFEDDVVY